MWRKISLKLKGNSKEAIEKERVRTCLFTRVLHYFKFLSIRQWKWKGDSITDLCTSGSLGEIHDFIKLLTLMLSLSTFWIGTYNALNLFEGTIKDSRCDSDLA